MKFKPSLAAEEFIENIHQRVGARNKAVLGRSALFLAFGEGVPLAFKPADAQGKDLDDETVIGDELREVVRAALNHRMGKQLDEAGYRQAFRQHFEYGCQRLKEIWEESSKPVSWLRCSKSPGKTLATAQNLKPTSLRCPLSSRK